MTFGNKRVKFDKVFLNEKELLEVPYTKFLGVTIDGTFTWKQHVHDVKMKLSRACGALYRIKDKVDTNVLLLLYNTLVLPHLSYCIEIWGNTYESRLREISMLQKRIIRIIGCVKLKDHTGHLFKKFGILKVKDLVRFKTCIFIYNVYNNVIPENVKNQFSKNTEIHKYHTRNSSNKLSSNVLL